MANITASDVNKLRQMTGAGMMDCKNALVENGGDFDKAIDFLRKKGQKLAAKRADRDANEGMVIAQTSADGKYASVLMISSETDFVAKNEEFVNFCKTASDLATKNMIKSMEAVLAMDVEGRSLGERITDLVGKIGEKIELTHFEFIEGPKVFAYNHNGNRLASIVAFDKVTSDEVGANVAMQIAAMSPVSIDENSVAKEVIEHELTLAREIIRQEGKPENMVEKIAQGKLNKFFKDNTLLHQEYIKDGKLSVGQYITNHGEGAKVIAFRRLMLGA
ncbi:MAG: translation elongation factor Ts [Bacteroidales bacterium]